ncbi:uncharacterized protein LOC142235730 [Haematobia irritans]|uniref:uncharacterized protein LOC142235730 n=1 Tax=Haematobia irritans TaxID=7368 RepID=UPI003F4FD36E
MGSLEDFLSLCEEVSLYEARMRNADTSKYNETTIEAEQNEIQELWSEWKNALKKCNADAELTKTNKATIKKSKTESQTKYMNCMTLIGEWKLKIAPTPVNQKTPSSSVSVPPCDTQVFQGDYVTWPSFRDLFTAIYINNKKLSPVEKLYHLFQKTAGEAREINKNVPLTSEGFEIAWANLKSQYENKRILINNQLRVLFNLSHCTQESASGLKQLHRDITNCISVLRLYDIDVKSWDPIFVFQCSSKLPRLTLSLWEQSIERKTELPKWDDLSKFLTERFHTLESVIDMIGDSSHRQKYNNADKAKQLKVHHTKINIRCMLCKGNHVLKSCPKFVAMDPKARLAVAKKNGLCLNCLTFGHKMAKCSNRDSCSKCNFSHHTLLHIPKATQQNEASNIDMAQSSQNQNIQSTEAPSTSENVRAYHTSVSNKTMLATAWVNILKDGASYKARALIDPCSDETFVSRKIQKLLKLPTKSVSADIMGLGGEFLTKCSEIAFFRIGSITQPKFSFEIDALVVRDVTGNVPTHSFGNVVCDQLPELEFADPHFYRTGPVDILLGGNLYPLILLKGVEHGILGSLVAQETVFGWVITGPTNVSGSRRKVNVSLCTRVSIDDQLKTFWEVEEVPKKSIVSDEDKICEHIYSSTTVRTPEGRYMVDLPFRPDNPLSSSKNSNRYVALSQFLRNEKSLCRKPELKRMYDDVIQEYLALGHMETVEPPGNSDGGGYFYLPHHGVFKPESTTTKLRVVFNASCPSANGKSLNDALFTGPVLQADIMSLILNWRMFKYVFNADISKMYRQVVVNPKHVPYQRILYRASPDDEICDYQLKTVTFGVNCAPFLALRTLLQLAEDEKEKYPIGSKILKYNMYVDDSLVGSHTVKDAVEARDQLIGILKSGGFQLRKWTSNNIDILKDLPLDHLLNKDFLDFGEKSTTKMLGVRWNAVEDSFYFVTEKLPQKESFTKREVLSAIARLFDPLGWLSPVLVKAKILLQLMWLDKIDWDDPITPLTLIKWRRFVSDYGEIDKITIPRWVHYSPNCIVEFHGFSDSSELAYAAAVYIRIEVEGNIYTQLLVSKSKVAPIKKLSVPRLELCGALLLAKLADAILPQLQIQQCAFFPWTDSTIVLSWLRKPSHSWTTFVANRVAIIQEKVNNSWGHVGTSENPADLATRGLTPLEIKGCDLWWKGPSWLRKEKQYWPTTPEVPETSMDARDVRVHIARSSEDENFLDRFSCLARAMRVLAYIYRFINSAHPSRRSFELAHGKRLSTAELAHSKRRLIVMSQKRHFPLEYSCLEKKKQLPSDSPLLSLTPFIDNNGIVRANGRLGSTTALSYGQRHPFILAYKSTLARLYVDFIHVLTLHGGIQLTLSPSRLECWIIRGRLLVKTRINNCRQCVVARNHRQGQIMAPLPEVRTTFHRPFAIAGVDFAGPYELKTFQGRGCRLMKGYVCLFVCFTTKAIHLEPVTDLSTSAFLAAFSRFVSRRGCPHKMYSDNGRNFVGAARELQASLKKIVSELRDEVVSKYGLQGVEWHFNPASAPHMGGLWEAGVKSCKTHLKKISGQIRHTFEEFATVLASIECCLNSRPLSPVSDNQEDLSALTPGHFLIGTSLLAPAEPEEIPSKTALLNRWRKVKIIQQEFCRRWKTEYMSELQKRFRWKSPQDNLALNDLVVIRQESIGPTDWRLGRVVKLYPGKDNHVRVVDVRTQSGIITRPVHKLVLLPRSQE